MSFLCVLFYLFWALEPIFANNRTISPTITTADVASVSCHQSFMLNGVTLNISPPKLTMSICPTIISSPTKINPRHFQIHENADVPVANALALNMFQNCSITNMVKNIDNS